MSDNATLPATGTVVRAIDKAGTVTQVTAIDIGGAGAETLLSAARRKAKALKVPSPEVVQAVEPEKLEAMLARFNLKFDLVTPLKNDDFAALHYIQEQLAIMQDDEDIELLLLTL